MGQFGTKTRQWLLSAIKQRKLLLRINRSHKSQLQVEIAIDILENLLNAYSYENDVYMAKFIRTHISSIETILPGIGAMNHEKRMRELIEINKHSILIIKDLPVIHKRIQEPQLTIGYEKTN